MPDNAEMKEEIYGRVALKRGLITREQLDQAEKRRSAVLASGKKIRLGEVMMQLGFITKDQALAVLKETHLALGDKPRIGGYQLERLLGKGGMGMVYKARQLSMDRPVALKLMSRDVSQNEDFVNRFMREARTTAKLNHINIIAAIDVGESNGYHYFAMEYVSGKTLEKLIQTEGGLPEKRVVEIAIQVVQGLEHAASHGIIHRDIKPANIMINREGVVKIADMGLALLTNRETSEQMTATGIAVGTPYYMAPEQVEGHSAVDFRVDIYALGATLFEALTGQKPWDGANVPAIMAKRLYEDPPDAAKVKKGVRRPIASVIRKMMARNPDDRYQDFATLLDDFRRIAEGKKPSVFKGPISTKARSLSKPRPVRDSSEESLQKRTTRHWHIPTPRTLTIGGVIGLCLAVVLGGILFYLKNAGDLQGPGHPHPESAHTSLFTDFKPDVSRGRRVRRLWKDIQKLRMEYEHGGSGARKVYSELCVTCEDLIQKYPDSAYAARATILLQRLKRRR